MNGWITVFPKGTGHQWFHLHTLCSVAVVSQWLQENYRITRVKAITIAGNDMRKWRITTRDKIKVFCAWMRNNCGTGQAKLRIEYKRRHHRP